MAFRGRILRYFLEILAIGLVLLIPTGCDFAVTLPSQLADELPNGNDDGSDDADDPADDVDSNADDDAADDDGPPTVAELPGDDGSEDPDAPGDDDPPPDDPGDEDPPPDDPGDDDPPPDDPGDDDPPPDDPGDDDPPPDDPGDDDPPPDDPGDDDPPPDDPDPDVPSNEYCDPVADWPDAWRDYEEEVLTLVNERRAAGADCGSYGTFNPTGPLEFDPALRCAARAHSMDMGERDFFSHTNPDGDGPGQRLTYAGYSGWGWGENIAWGYPTPAAVVNGWMNSPGHCSNMMRTQWTIIGIGYYEGNIWTQTFGSN